MSGEPDFFHMTPEQRESALRQLEECGLSFEVKMIRDLPGKVAVVMLPWHKDDYYAAQSRCDEGGKRE